MKLFQRSNAATFADIKGADQGRVLGGCSSSTEL